MKIFVSYVNAQPWVTSSDVDLNNQVNRMIHSVDTSQPLFPANSVIAYRAHEQSGRGSRDRGYTWVQEYGHPLTKGNITITTKLSAAEINNECPIGHHSLG